MTAPPSVAPSPATPRASATMMLLRDCGGVGGGFEVFMVVRHHQIEFASGALVFPGGSVDEDDRAVAARPELCPAAGADTAAATLRIAAIRETFEECGILLARPYGSQSVVSAERLKLIEPAWRARLCAGEVKFSAILDAEALVPATDLLVPFAHWITPEHMPKRFDTHFFAAVAPADQVGLHDGHESVDSVWIAPRQAIEEADAGQRTLVFATRLNLDRLSRSRSAAEAVAAARESSIVTVQPVLAKTAQGHTLTIPLDAGYGAAVYAITLP